MSAAAAPPELPAEPAKLKPVAGELLGGAIERLTGKTPRQDRLRADRDAYRVLCKWWFLNGQRPFLTSRQQMAIAFKDKAGPAAGFETQADVDAVLKTRDREKILASYHMYVARRLRSLKALGLIDYETARSDGSGALHPGMSKCLRVWLTWPDAATQRSITATRLTRERSTKRRRSSFFTSRNVDPEGPPLRGVRKGNSSWARARAGPSFDDGSPGSGAVQGSGDTTGTKEGRVETLVADVALGAPHRCRLIEAFELLFGQPARFSHRRHGARLDRILAVLDRHADFGAGRRGAGAALLVDMLRAAAVDVAYFGDKPPGSLAYFLPELENTSRAWQRAERVRQARQLGLDVKPGEPIRSRLRAERRRRRQSNKGDRRADT